MCTDLPFAQSHWQWWQANTKEWNQTAHFCGLFYRPDAPQNTTDGEPDHLIADNAFAHILHGRFGYTQIGKARPAYNTKKEQIVNIHKKTQRAHQHRERENTVLLWMHKKVKIGEAGNSILEIMVV